jgi:hypothetical protein
MPFPIEWPVEEANNTFALVGADSTLVLAANDRRQDTEFVNDSDQIIYLARGEDAVMNSGIRLNANGGSYTIGLFNLFLGDVYAICEKGQANLTISEGHKA